MDIPAGTGFSYSETKDGWISSDNILATHAKEFIKKVKLSIILYAQSNIVLEK